MTPWGASSARAQGGALWAGWGVSLADRERRRVLAVRMLVNYLKGPMLYSGSVAGITGMDTPGITPVRSLPRRLLADIRPRSDVVAKLCSSKHGQPPLPSWGLGKGR